MRLNAEPFRDIISGRKTVELRLYDQKRSALSVGDIILFSDITNENQTATVEIIALHRADNFVSLFTDEILFKCGWGDKTAEHAAECMRNYYTEKEELSLGVLGIEFKII